MADRIDLFEERLKLLREQKIEPSAFLARIGEYFGLVPIVGERRGTNFNVAMLRGESPDETFFPIFTSAERFAASFFSQDHEALHLPLDTIIRQIRLDSGIAINPGTDFAYNFSPFTLQKHLRAFGADTVVEEVTPEWLSNLNDQFSKHDVPHSQRTWRAMAEWSKRNHTSLAYDSWRCEFITTWFAGHIKPAADHIGLLAKAAYFYDATFWPVEVPIILGQPEGNPLDLLAMPASVRMRLLADRNELYLYLKFWADCVDYYYGISDVRDPSTLNNPLLHGCFSLVANNSRPLHCYYWNTGRMPKRPKRRRWVWRSF
jgi:SseB protein N-terminal domain